MHLRHILKIKSVQFIIIMRFRSTAQLLQCCHAQVINVNIKFIGEKMLNHNGRLFCRKDMKITYSGNVAGNDYTF